MKARLWLPLAMVGLALMLCGVAFAVSNNGRSYKVFYNDAVSAPTVGVDCVVGHTPPGFRTTLQSRYVLMCVTPANAPGDPRITYMSDAGIVVTKGVGQVIFRSRR